MEVTTLPPEVRADPGAPGVPPDASQAEAPDGAQLDDAFSDLPFHGRLVNLLSDSMIPRLLRGNPDAVLPFFVRPGDLTDEVRSVVDEAVRRFFPGGGFVKLFSDDVPASGDHSEDPFAPLTAAGFVAFGHRVDRVFDKVLARDPDGLRSGRCRAEITLRPGDWFRSLPKGALSSEMPFSFLAYLRRYSKMNAVSFTGGSPSAESLPASASPDVQHLRDRLSQLSPHELPDDFFLAAAFLGKNYRLERVEDFSTLQPHQQLVVVVDGDAEAHLVDQSFRPTRNPVKWLRRAFNFNARTLRPPRLEDLPYRKLPLGVIEGQDSPSAEPQIVLTRVESMDDGVAGLARPGAGMIALRDLSLHAPSSGEDASLRYVYMDPHVARNASSGRSSKLPSYTYEIKQPKVRVLRVEYCVDS